MQSRDKKYFFLFVLLFSLVLVSAESFGYNDRGLNVQITTSSANISNSKFGFDTDSGVNVRITTNGSSGSSNLTLAQLLSFGYYNSTNFNIADYLLIATFNANYSANDEAYRNQSNSTYNAYNSTGLIRDWNVSGYIRDWNVSGYIKDWNASGWIINWSQQITGNFVSLSQLLGFAYFNETTKNITNNSYQLKSNYTDWNVSGYIRDWNTSGQIKDWNASGYIINWSQQITSGFVSLSQLLGFGYYNSTNFNIADYLLISSYNANYSANDAAYRDITNISYRTLTNGTFTTNITLASSTYCIVNNTASSAFICHNGTGWVIKG